MTNPNTLDQFFDHLAQAVAQVDAALAALPDARRISDDPDLGKGLGKLKSDLTRLRVRAMVNS